VFSVKGRVLFENAERNDFQPVTLKSRINSGDTVRSSDGASINLALIPAALAQLPGDSEIKIDELSITKDGNQTAGSVRGRTARIRLSRGKVIVLFIPTDRSASQFAVTTDQLTIKPDSDCLFCVWTDGKTTRLTCTKGKITASADAQPVTIAAGYFQEWPTTRKAPVPATEDAAAQIDITESLEAEQRLQNEASAWQNRRPFY
jgi:ferric-dicitrate binding protein FerR (iron transport regulator)